MDLKEKKKELEQESKKKKRTKWTKKWHTFDAKTKELRRPKKMILELKKKNEREKGTKRNGIKEEMWIKKWNKVSVVEQKVKKQK